MKFALHVFTYLYISIQCLANPGLPPTSSKGYGDSVPKTTFNFQFPNFTITHTGVTAVIGPFIPRITSTTSSSTPTPNCDTTDLYTLSALAVSATFGAPSGTPTDGQSLIIRIKDNGTSQALAWNVVYKAVGVLLPTATIISKDLYIAFIWDAPDSTWDAVGVNQE